MLSRPVDSSVDVLPVLTPGDLLSGPEAAAAGLSDHLRLFAGDWWESADRGNRAIGLISSSRLTDRDLPALSGTLSAYLLPVDENLSALDPVKTSYDIQQSRFAASRRTQQCNQACLFKLKCSVLNDMQLVFLSLIEIFIYILKSYHDQASPL